MERRYLLFSFMGMTEHPSSPDPRPYADKTYLYDCTTRFWYRRSMHSLPRRAPSWVSITDSEVPAINRTQALLNG